MRKAKTGISGLDEVLSGGLSRGHVFLLEGEPGAGKTTVAVQFLLEGAKAGERSLYITLSESEQELRQGAASHGWTLGSEIEVFELIPPESLLAEEQQQSLLYSYDLELRETTKQIVDAVERATRATESAHGVQRRVESDIPDDAAVMAEARRRN